MGEQGSIGAKAYYIGISLQTSHEGSLCQRAFPGVFIFRIDSRFALCRIFSRKYLVSVPIVVIVAGRIFQKPFRRCIIMFVYNFGVKSFQFTRSKIKEFSIRGGACTRNKSHLRIFLLDFPDKSLIPFDVLGSPLFIAYPQHLQVEGGRMAHVCPYFSPLGFNGSIGKFDQIEGILDIRFELVHRHHFRRIKLAGHSATQDWKRFRPQIFCQLKIFEEPHPE